MSAADFLTVVGAVLSLSFLEGLLSADNALVLAVMVRHLPKGQRRRALRLGIWGAFVFRAIAVLSASYLFRFWWLKVGGGLYLLYLAVKHFLLDNHGSGEGRRSRFGDGFWATVVSVEIADIAFSIDSILAAVALAESLPAQLGQMVLGVLPFFGPIQLKLLVIYVGGVLGIIAMRLVAGVFLILLERFRGLAEGAYVLVAWIGLELLGSGVQAWKPSLPLDMPNWLFWIGMALIVSASLIYKPRRHPPDDTAAASEVDRTASPDGAARSSDHDSPKVA